MDSQPLRLVLLDCPAEVSRPFIPGHLYVAVAIEIDGTLSLVTDDDLDDLGLTLDEAFDVAWTALRQGSPAADLREVDTLPDLKVYDARDGLASSRMAVLPQILDPMPLGGVVVAVPEPDEFLCAPMESAASIDGLQSLASALGHFESTRDGLLSDQLFWYDGVEWHVIPVDHGSEDITVNPPEAFVRMMSRLASVDWVQVAGEA
ncbi:MAG: hypothetical protein AAF602_26180 [Myxococcota bacterium]